MRKTKNKAHTTDSFAVLRNIYTHSQSTNSNLTLYFVWLFFLSLSSFLRWGRSVCGWFCLSFFLIFFFLAHAAPYEFLFEVLLLVRTAHTQTHTSRHTYSVCCFIWLETVLFSDRIFTFNIRYLKLTSKTNYPYADFSYVVQYKLLWHFFFCLFSSFIFAILQFLRFVLHIA